MVSPNQSHKESKIINSMDLAGFKKYYRFLLQGGTVEEFVKKVEAGVIKVKRQEQQLGTVTPKFSVIEDED